ncbi:hypothetical protein [Candidatus Laterigemmans baculatus]|uniref:hypothetical protein n=1 Tax=Candidatus Laterigemmans baculatus TaxID=2770505 RepID=UPI0013D9BB7E|nr:hypothetical protein [Candidatus Laterigemmans baculatus]
MNVHVNKRRVVALAGLLGAALAVLLSVPPFGSAEAQDDSSARYQRNGDVETLRYLLSTRIQSGDSLDRVTALLGPGDRDDGDYLALLLKWKAGAHYDPQILAPDGIQGGDLFIHYSAAPMPAYPLQFRDGVLINHDPQSFVGPDETIGSLSN